MLILYQKKYNELALIAGLFIVPFIMVVMRPLTSIDTEGGLCG